MSGGHLRHDPQMSGSASCCRCDLEKPVIMFAVCKVNRNGLDSWCRECRQADNSKRSRSVKWDKGQDDTPASPAFHW